MAKLEAMQRLADKEVTRLGIPTNLTVRWSGGDCRCTGRSLAHAHVSGDRKGTICIKHPATDWRNTIRHEVAHFGPKGGTVNHGSPAFLRARAKQGNRIAKQRLVVMGLRRCPGHEWNIVERKESKVTSRGLLRLYKAYCRKCGKEIG